MLRDTSGCGRLSLRGTPGYVRRGFNALLEQYSSGLMRPDVLSAVGGCAYNMCHAIPTGMYGGVIAAHSMGPTTVALMRAAVELLTLLRDTSGYARHTLRDTSGYVRRGFARAP